MSSDLRFESEFLELVAALRDNPVEFANLIENQRLPLFKDDFHFVVNDVEYECKEGKNVVLDLIQQLKSLKSLPSVQSVELLSLATKRALIDNIDNPSIHHVFEFAQEFGSIEKETTFQCVDKKSVPSTPLQILIDMLIDDGDKKRRKRNTILSSNARFVAVSHKNGTTLLVLCVEWTMPDYDSNIENVDVVATVGDVDDDDLDSIAAAAEQATIARSLSLTHSTNVNSYVFVDDDESDDDGSPLPPPDDTPPSHTPNPQPSGSIDGHSVAGAGLSENDDDDGDSGSEPLPPPLEHNDDTFNEFASAAPSRQSSQMLSNPTKALTSRVDNNDDDDDDSEDGGALRRIKSDVAVGRRRSADKASKHTDDYDDDNDNDDDDDDEEDEPLPSSLSKMARDFDAFKSAAPSRNISSRTLLAGSSISPEALHAALSEAHREQREGKTKFDRAATTSARRKSNDKKKSSSGSRKSGRSATMREKSLPHDDDNDNNDIRRKSGAGMQRSTSASNVVRPAHKRSSSVDDTIKLDLPPTLPPTPQHNSPRKHASPPQASKLLPEPVKLVAKEVTTVPTSNTTPLQEYKPNMLGVATNEVLSDELRARAAARTTSFNIKSVDNDLKLLEVVGKGTFGAVYRAEHLTSKRELAAKRLHYRNDDEKKTIDTELAIIAACDCRYIVAYYGQASSPGAQWIFMEFCVSSVADVIEHYVPAKQSFSESELYTILVSLMRALAYLHELKIIHRDVKADNLLINTRGAVRLADFGVSGQMAGPMTSMVGTPAFIAPEVVGANPNDVNGYDIKVDIWAAGITAIECADLVAPYDGVNPFRVLFKITSSPSPTLLKPESRSDELNEFIAMCLKKDPNERPNATTLLESAAFFAKHKNEVDKAAPADDNGATPSPLPPPPLTEALASVLAADGSEADDETDVPSNSKNNNDQALMPSPSMPAVRADTNKKNVLLNSIERGQSTRPSSSTGLEKGRSAAEVKALIREKKNRHRREAERRRAAARKAAEKKLQRGTTTTSSSSRTDDHRSMEKAARSERRSGRRDQRHANRRDERSSYTDTPPTTRSRRSGTVDDSSRTCGMCGGRAKSRVDGIMMCRACIAAHKREATFELAVAQADFVGTGEVELSFEKSDRIIVRERDAAGWAFGYVQGDADTLGWFPAERVRTLRAAAVSTLRPKAPSKPKKVGKIPIERRVELAGLLSPIFKTMIRRSSRVKPLSPAPSPSPVTPRGTALVHAKSARPAKRAPAPPGTTERSSSDRATVSPRVKQHTSGSGVKASNVPRRGSDRSSPRKTGSARVATPPPSMPAPSPGAPVLATPVSTSVAVSMPRATTTATESPSAAARRMAQAAAPPSMTALFAGAELDLLLWALTSEMKLGRQKQRFKRYENCFTGSALIEWFQTRLRVDALRAQALAQDLARRRAIIDLLADFDEAPFFKSKSFFRFALGDSSIPLNAARLCDKADDIWLNNAALHPERATAAVRALMHRLYPHNPTMTATVLSLFVIDNYIPLSTDDKARANMLRNPAEFARRLLSDLVTQIQTLHARQPAQTLAKSEGFKAWALRTCYLQRVPLDALNEVGKRSFFVNLHNMLMFHGHVLLGAPPDAPSHAQLASTIRYFTDEALYSMDDIWHGILRGDTQRYLRFKNDAKKRTRVCTEKQPLVSLALSRGRQSSSPPLMLIGADDARTGLFLAAQAFAHDNVRVDRNNFEVLLPDWLEPCMSDFGENQAAQLKFLCKLLPFKKVKVYVIQHARALDIRYVPAASWDADYSFYDWWVPKDIAEFENDDFNSLFNQETQE